MNCPVCTFGLKIGFSWFPPHIVSTDERPYIVIYSNITKCVIMIELTSPCEENFDERHEYKLWWYNDLLGEAGIVGGVCIFLLWKSVPVVTLRTL